MSPEDTSTETKETSEATTVEYKPYNLKELGKDLKQEGLELTEDAAEKVYVAIKSWLKKSAAVTSTPIDDMVVGFLDKLDPIVLPIIDKIDGQKG